MKKQDYGFLVQKLEGNTKHIKKIREILRRCFKMEKALTYTIIAGSKACYNNCPICISKMTPDYSMDCRLPEVNWKKFDEATTVALNHRSEEHTSELQSQFHLVCRLLLEKK